MLFHSSGCARESRRLSEATPYHKGRSWEPLHKKSRGYALGTYQHGQTSSVLWNDAGIRGEFRVNTHLHWFVLAISASEHDVVCWCERSEFDAPATFWTEGSERKRKPISPMSPEFPRPLDCALIYSRLDSPGATIPCVSYGGEGERSALRFLKDEDKEVHIALLPKV